MSIFVSYRRGATTDIVGRICDRLGLEYADVFHDVNSIDVGVDFVARTEQALKRADVLLAVIGPDWLGDGRIQDPADWVRREIEMALRRSDVHVVPVLVGGMTMPDEASVPPSLHPLLRRNAISIASGAHFSDQMNRLVAALRPYVEPPGDARAGTSSKRPYAWAIAAVLLVGSVSGAAAVVGNMWSGGGGGAGIGGAGIGGAEIGGGGSEGGASNVHAAGKAGAEPASGGTTSQPAVGGAAGSGINPNSARKEDDVQPTKTKEPCGDCKPGEVCCGDKCVTLDRPCRASGSCGAAQLVCKGGQALCEPTLCSDGASCCGDKCVRLGDPCTPVVTRSPQPQCRAGTQRCVRSSVVCEPPRSRPEICGNEIDEDCNGRLDNGCPEQVLVTGYKMHCGSLGGGTHTIGATCPPNYTKGRCMKVSGPENGGGLTSATAWASPADNDCTCKVSCQSSDMFKGGDWTFQVTAAPRVRPALP